MKGIGIHGIGLGRRIVMGGGEIPNFPFVFDAQLFPDGNLSAILPNTIMPNGHYPQRLYGNKWAVLSGKTYCVPDMDAEMLTDPGLEGTYVAGLAPDWSIGASCTPLQSADVHGGAKAQQIDNTAAGDAWYVYKTLHQDKLARMSMWVKRLAGASDNIIPILYNLGLWNNSYPIVEAAYTNRVVMDFAQWTGVGVIAVKQNGAGTGDTVVVDDVSIRELTDIKQCFAFPNVPFNTSEVHLKARVTLDQWCMAGFALCWDSATNPQNGLLCVVYRINATTQIVYSLYKCLAGIWSLVNGSSAPLYYDKILIEAYKSGTNVNLQIGDFWGGGLNVAVNDAEIINNTWHGIFSSDQIESILGFSCGPVVDAPQVPAILMTLDDLYAEHYSICYPYLKALGLKATVIVNSDWAVPGNITWAELATMYADGFDMINGGKTHGNIFLMTYAQQMVEMGDCQTALDAHGFTRASHICGLPGNPNADTPQVMTDMGVQYVINEILSYTPYGYHLPKTNGYSWTTAAQMIADIDTEMAAGNSIGFSTHNLGGLGLPVADWEQVMDYIAASGYKTETQSDRWKRFIY